jgi:preprotein translocase subunit SecF
MKFWPLVKVLPVKTNLHFVRYARVFAALSVLAVIGSLALSLYPFKPPCFGLACGIDFKGGTVMEVSTAPKSVDTHRIRVALEGANLGEVQVQGIGGDTTKAVVRFQSPEGADATKTDPDGPRSPDPGAGARDLLAARHGGRQGLQRTARQGPLGAGRRDRLDADLHLVPVRAAVRPGAVAALFHDVFLTFGLIAVLRIEFNLQAVAAILTIIGYSMNDTVVVFDRFRENLRKYKRMPLGEVIDLSINEMLTRTLVTSFTGVLALVALAVLGGPTLYGLSVIMLFGILIGTYSSIYIAAPGHPAVGRQARRRGSRAAEAPGRQALRPSWPAARPRSTRTGKAASASPASAGRARC